MYLIAAEAEARLNGATAIDYLLATTEKKDKVFVILMNNRAQATDFQISIKGAAAKARQLPALGFEILTITL